MRHVVPVLSIAVWSALPTLAFAQLQTPSPTITLGSPCSAVVTYAWDVSAIPATSRVEWELKRDADFNVPDDDDPEATDSGQIAGAVGSVTLDLRDYGRVLDKTPYYFRVVALRGGNDLALRSEPVVFSEQASPGGAFRFAKITEYGTQAILSWSLVPPIEGCADRVFFEISRGPAFTRLAPDPAAVFDGEMLAPTGFHLFDLGPLGEGDYVARIRARFGDGGEDDAVGLVAEPARITIARARLADRPVIPGRGRRPPVVTFPVLPPAVRPGAPRLVEVQAAEASLYAETRGYATTVSRQSGIGTCRLVAEGPPGERFYALRGDPARNAQLGCRLDLFEGRDLAPGWRIVSVAARLDDAIVAPATTTGGGFPPPISSLSFECLDNGGSMVFLRAPSGTDDPHVALRLAGDWDQLNCIPPTAFVRMFVETVVLEGPVDNWRLAFDD